MIFSKQKYFFIIILVVSIGFFSSTISPAYANSPTATITYSEAGPYKSGDEITITATFKEAVKLAITQ
tara:strand:+ start:238 stop:441 length:204 start_codon:yes stop_codon:yes gene_type:complete